VGAIRLILVGFFVYLAVTIAAFVYLEWWQAILASAVTFILFLRGVRWLLLSFVRGMGDTIKQIADFKSRVLRGATADVHSVRRVEPPRHLADPDPDDDEPPEPGDVGEFLAEIENRDWYEIEATIFPDPAPAGPMKSWDPYELMFVPIDEGPLDELADDAHDRDVLVEQVRVVRDGEAVELGDASMVRGPQRLRVLAGFPKRLGAVKFRYYYEDFGRVELPGQLLP
jgi:hypothetical protein